MAATHVPHFMGSILIAALVIQVACAIINLFIKISTHTAAIGGVTGALLAFQLYFRSIRCGGSALCCCLPAW